ncbi:MAG TPA: hypothetical protein DD738_15470 [Ruminiclostridium sp.]|nr:hypothetical protein [Ruminiclostridium sp.]
MKTESKKKISEEIFEQMKHMIVSGQWKPGDKLPSEKELTEIFHASRISVREPIKQLVSLGMLETRHGAGTFVRGFNEDQFTIPIASMIYGQKLTKNDILQILDLRQIEIIITGLAAEKCDKEGIQELWRIYHQMEEGQNDPHVHLSSDYAFHLQISKMTQNPYLVKICRLLYETLEEALKTIVVIMGPQKALYYHNKLIDTISRHYVIEAKATMEEHLKTTIDAVKAIPETSNIFADYSK